MSGRAAFGWFALLMGILFAAPLIGANYPPEDQPLLLVTSQQEVDIHIYSFKKNGHFCFMIDKHGYAPMLECPR